MEKKHKIHLIGNAHIDPVWLWRWQEGFSEIKATFRSALDRINEFPEFVFTSSCAAYYQWIEENEPEMFNEISRRIDEGRWVLAGGWWIQPDCNIPSGESFARHGLYSQRYFLEKFGTMAKTGYNVDSFGHSAMLPQILKKSGMDNYVFMRPDNNENDIIPGPLFWWESEDGSRVMAFRIPTSYGSWWSDNNSAIPMEQQKVMEAVRIADEKEYPVMDFYGVGNHGGGPTITNLNLIRKFRQELGKDRLVPSSPDQYFEDALKSGAELPVFKNEFQHHASGCYSTTWEIKAGNRKAENRLLSAEKFSALAHGKLELPYPGKKLQSAWENVLFNQFHDIMGGCCIKEAVGDAIEWHGEALSTSGKILNAAVQKISWAVDTMGEDLKNRSKEKDWYLWEESDKGAPVIVFNPLSWEVNVPVQVNKILKGVADYKGNPLEVQTVRGSQTNKSDKWNSMFVATVPAMGYKLYWMYLTKVFEPEKSQSMLRIADDGLENDFVKLEFEPHTGYIRNFYDKVNDVQVLSGKGSVPVVIDIDHCDTWAHRIFEFRDEVARFADARIKVIESGYVRAKLRVESSYNHSVLRQDFILYKDKPGVEVQVKLDWREKHKLLKLSFPVNVEEPKAAYEIPYGFIERPVNGEEEPGQQWVDVTGLIGQKQYGMALLNDSKYSFDIKDSEMRMTVANGSVYADHFANYGEKYRDDLCEYMDQSVQEFRYILVPHAGDWKDAGVSRMACELNTPPVHIMETYHRGTMPQEFEGLRISSDHIAATVFKKAEDGSGYILRCCETSGREAEAIIEIPFLNIKWTQKFGKCEIKTFRITEAPDSEVCEKNLLEL